jgi:hypothetical protein
MTVAEVGPEDAQQAAGETSGSTLGWIVSLVLFPYGPTVYLARLKAIPWGHAVFLLLACVLLHVGLGTVLAKTNEDRSLQPWLVLILGGGYYLLGMVHYTAGALKGIWSAQADRLWRFFGWLFGVLLFLYLLVQIVWFHIVREQLLPL